MRMLCTLETGYTNRLAKKDVAQTLSIRTRLGSCKHFTRFFTYWLFLNTAPVVKILAGSLGN